MTKNRSKRPTPQFDRELCIACTSCIDICPTGALEPEIRNSIHGFRRFPVLSQEEKCIRCSLCEQECIVGAIEMKERKGSGFKVQGSGLKT